jgi:DNA-binding NtrC family response regulator
MATSRSRLSVWCRWVLRGGAPPPATPSEALNGAGVEVRPPGGDAARRPGLVFFDAIGPELCEALRELSHDGVERVLAIAIEGRQVDSGGAWLLLRCGASDVFAWDHSADPAAEVAARLSRWAAVDRLVGSPLVRDNLIGGSPGWTGVLRQVVEAASFTETSVLITGESGTGKELVARLVHSLDPRPRKRELVVLDCTTIVPELAGSEFFGHERGAYTGAVGPRDGAFALADGGTLFLDEVGELPPGMQAQLLRVVQEGTYKRVGGSTWQRTRFRLVCATNRDLAAEMSCGRFRADLYHRIAGVVCHTPALRDRPDDVIPLFNHFLAEARGSGDPAELDGPVREHLLRRAYPGNVRDLKQLASRVANRHVGPGPITGGDLPEDERPADGRAETADGLREAGFEEAEIAGLRAGGVTK